MAKMSHVDAFMERGEFPKKAEVEAVISIILEAEPSIKKEIKWNAPSLFVDDHFATVKPRPLETVQVVFHTGGKSKRNPVAITVDDPDNLLKWVTEDRCMAIFNDMADIQARAASFTSVVRQWITQL